MLICLRKSIRVAWTFSLGPGHFQEEAIGTSLAEYWKKTAASCKLFLEGSLLRNKKREIKTFSVKGNLRESIASTCSKEQLKSLIWKEVRTGLELISHYCVSYFHMIFKKMNIKIFSAMCGQSKRKLADRWSWPDLSMVLHRCLKTYTFCAKTTLLSTTGNSK